MSEKILVYIDQFKGKALPTSWEALNAANWLVDQVGGDVGGVNETEDDVEDEDGEPVG